MEKNKAGGGDWRYPSPKTPISFTCSTFFVFDSTDVLLIFYMDFILIKPNVNFLHPRSGLLLESKPHEGRALYEL